MKPNKSWGYMYQTAWGCICMKSFTRRFQFFLAFFDTFEAKLNGVAGCFRFFSIRILFFGAGRNYECCKQPGGGSRTPLILGGSGTWMWLWKAMATLRSHPYINSHVCTSPKAPHSFLISNWFKFPTSNKFLEIESTQKPPPSKKANSFWEFGRC